MEKDNIPYEISKRTPIPILIFELGFLPKAQPVSPAPDGGYPGQNTAEGQSALLNLAGGTYNTALGWASLGFNVTGNYNTGVGGAAAYFLNNTAGENTATGAGALLNNTTGGLKATRPTAPSRSLPMPPETGTRLPVLMPFLATPQAAATPPTVTSAF